jgi:hypothetical protein
MWEFCLWDTSAVQVQDSECRKQIVSSDRVGVEATNFLLSLLLLLNILRVG